MLQETSWRVGIHVLNLHSISDLWDFKGLTVFIPYKRDSLIANHYTRTKVSQGISRDFPIYAFFFYFRVPYNEVRVYVGQFINASGRTASPTGPYLRWIFKVFTSLWLVAMWLNRFSRYKTSFSILILIFFISFIPDVRTLFQRAEFKVALLWRWFMRKNESYLTASTKENWIYYLFFTFFRENPNLLNEIISLAEISSHKF